jgi:hypothetical protein
VVEAFDKQMLVDEFFLPSRPPGYDSMLPIQTGT